MPRRRIEVGPDQLGLFWQPEPASLILPAEPVIVAPLEPGPVPGSTTLDARLEATYELTPDEVEHVETVTRRVLEWQRARQARDRFTPEDHHLTDLRAFCAEFAASRLTGLPWIGPQLDTARSARINGRKVADIGSRTEVRSTHHPNGHLIFNVGVDDESFDYLFMVGDVPVYRAAGWLPGRELATYPIVYGRIPGRWAPQGALRPWLELPEMQEVRDALLRA